MIVVHPNKNATLEKGNKHSRFLVFTKINRK